MRRVLDAMGAFLGWLLWTLHVRRKVIMDNLRLAFPEWTEAQRRAVGRKTMLNVGRMAPEFLTASRLSKEELEKKFVYDPVMEDRLRSAYESKQPLIVCSGHFGNFENLAAAHNLQGYPIVIIVRRLGGGWFGRFWNRGRSNAGLEVLEVTRGETLKAAQRAMRQGKVLAYVIDQNMSARRAIFPTFFGIPAATAPTPAILAMRTKANVFFMLDLPLGDGRHQIIAEGPLQVPDTGDHDADVMAFMQDLNDRLERWVREYPDRWYWLHRRWKTRPPADGAGGGRKARAARTDPGEPAGAPQIDPGGGAE